ncbi:peptide deformylase [Brachybacterium hainanense]|uniref:Peptide deformylase n=1 Tax=Brachybacterium hainanense TaxID=1541174 RepID=A0ABV6RDR8_9MICO
MDLTQLVTKTLDRRSRAGAPLRIVQAGHPALRSPARDGYGRLPTALLLELIEAMTVTMRAAPGVGLAAPQVGIPMRLFVIEDRSAEDGAERDAEDDLLERDGVPLRAVLDPAYEALEEDGRETVYAWEGCLSVEDWRSIVPRPRSIRFRGLEVDGRGDVVEVEEVHRGWPARILQHETDHLAGTLCHDLGVPRSFVQSRYVARYADMPEAVRWLGLDGEIARLGTGEAVIRS